MVAAAVSVVVVAAAAAAVAVAVAVVAAALVAVVVAAAEAVAAALRQARLRKKHATHGNTTQYHTKVHKSTREYTEHALTSPSQT